MDSLQHGKDTRSRKIWETKGLMLADMKTFEGMLDGSGKRFALVVGRFNDLVSERLLEGALDTLRRHGCAEEDLHVYRVPGAFEIPLLAQKIAQKGGYHGLLGLGCLIRGATPHFEYIATQCTRGLAQVAEKNGIPVGFGVLTCDTLDQALERAGSKAGNKGAQAAEAVLETADLLQHLP